MLTTGRTTNNSMTFSKEGLRGLLTPAGFIMRLADEPRGTLDGGGGPIFVTQALVFLAKAGLLSFAGLGLRRLGHGITQGLANLERGARQTRERRRKREQHSSAPQSATMEEV